MCGGVDQHISLDCTRAAAELFLLQCQKEEAKILVRDAIRAGIFNDLGSGGNVDLTVIEKVCCSTILLYHLINWM